MASPHATLIGRERLAAVEALQSAVDDVTRELEGRPLPPVSGGPWGPREVLCHLVYWHETYASVLHAMHRHETPPLKVGVFREFNQVAVEELSHVPADILLNRLQSAQRRVAVELLQLSPAARIRVKTGSMARGPVEFARRVEAHFRGHLADIRRGA